ncbi:MAG: hypothetical protein E7597_07435 [Ruminococcaceae bacterium]|nr:hypothetical protein [Oscillospiraceae bacterium]
MKKRIISLALVLITVLSSFSVVCTAAASVTGDTNGDGNVNSLDAAWILQYDASLREEIQNGDVNIDGAVDSLDAAQVLKYDAKLLESFPLAPTEDSSDEESSPEESSPEESSPEESEAPPAEDEHAFRTSHYDGEYVAIFVDGTTLRVSGVLEYEGVDAVWIRMHNEDDTVLDDKYIDVPPHGKFYAGFDLSGINDRVSVSLYHHTSGDINSWSYINRGRYYISCEDGAYYLEQSPVLAHNTQLLDEYIDPSEGFYFLLSPQMRIVSDRLSKREQSDYEKMHTLFKWVTENIYYDLDFYSGATESTNLSPEDVYLNRYAVCQGYANLLCALLQAQGIPCIVTEVYGQFPMDVAGAEMNTANHVVVEAYLEEEDRWVIMDPTWSSANRYSDGTFTAGYNLSRYFDITVEELSVCHKIITRKAPWFWYF